MPIFAILFGSVINALVSFLARFMSMRAALNFAAYTTLLATFTGLLATVYMCANSLYTMAAEAMSSGGGAGGGVSWPSLFWMGLGIFIPANAGAVMSCVASIWIACAIYDFQKQAIKNFSV